MAAAQPSLPLDLSRFGELTTPPKSFYPYVPGEDGIPFPEFDDPFDFGERAIEATKMFTVPDGRLAGKTFFEALAPYLDVWLAGEGLDEMIYSLEAKSEKRFETWGYAVCTQRNSAAESRYQVGFGPWYRALDVVMVSIWKIG